VNVLCFGHPRSTLNARKTLFFHAECAIRDGEALRLSLFTQRLKWLPKHMNLPGSEFRIYDALHIASAIVGEADYFITTDERLLRKMRGNDEMRVMLPNIALAELEGWYED